MMTERYIQTKEKYAGLGVDTDAAIKQLKQIPISMHCWQGDDIGGFEGHLTSGGIQATGNYPGKARNPQELMADMDMALSLIPGKHRINLHAMYGIFDNNKADRDEIKPEHFAPWVLFAKKRGLGLDFNPTFFAHPKAENGTLSAVCDETRVFWIRHGQASIRLGEYFANELGTPSTVNIWIPDGYKEVPADRLSPRARLKDSLDQIIGIPYDKSKVNIAVESKLFGIGLENYTVGSHEFYMLYAARNGLLCLLDNGHFHPTESVADKISSMLLFSEKVALHVTRSVRWDSDHVPMLDDEVKAIANEIILAGSDRVIIGLDFFDASINRVAAWVMGMRNMQKALLLALLTPHEKFKELQNTNDFTALSALREELKMYPAGDVWEEFCGQNEVPGAEWLKRVKEYEGEILGLRG